MSGCVSQEHTKAEALENIREAVELYLATEACADFKTLAEGDSTGIFSHLKIQASRENRGVQDQGEDHPACGISRSGLV